VEHGVVEEALEQRRGAKDPEPRDRDRGGQLHAIVAAAAAVVVLAGDQHGGGHVLFAVVLEQGREAGGEEHRERGLQRVGGSGPSPPLQLPAPFSPPLLQPLLFFLF
jgi:hypothetical protein